MLRAENTRIQARNCETARERIMELIPLALIVPKRRVATKPTYGGQLRRIAGKAMRGEVKAMRGKAGEEE